MTADALAPDWLDRAGPILAISLLVSSFLLIGVLLWRQNRRSSL